MIKIEELTKRDDLKRLVHLFNSLYPRRPVKKDYALWRYIDNPFEPNTFLIKERNKVIGSYSSCIFEGLVENKKGRIGFLYDLMVDPDHQNRGLVLPLYSAVFDSIKKRSPKFLYAFVNKISLPLYTEFFKWKEVNRLNLHIGKVKKIKLFLQNKSLAYDDIKFRKGLSKKIAELNIQAFRDENIKTFILRSDKFLNWRSRKIYGKDFTIYSFFKGNTSIGFCQIKLFKDEQDYKITADILDIIVYPKENIFSVLYLMCQIIEDLGIEKIATCGFGQIQNEKLHELGFGKSSLGWDLITYNLVGKRDQEIYVNMLDAEMF